MATTALSLLRTIEAADRSPDLGSWVATFAHEMTAETGARACQVLRVLDGGERLETLGTDDPQTRAILASGHAGLDAEQRRRLYRSGATAVTLADVHGDAVPQPLSSALQAARVADILGLVAPPGVSVGLFLPQPMRLDARTRQLHVALAHHVGASIAVRAALSPREGRAEGDTLPARLSGAIEELERRRRWARRRSDEGDAAHALRFLRALSEEGYAVVQATRSGTRQRLVAVRVKDSGGRALRLLDPGERDVLRGLSRGLSLKEIAFELQIAEASVSNRIARIRTKLGLDPRAELVRVASALRDDH